MIGGLSRAEEVVRKDFLRSAVEHWRWLAQPLGWRRAGLGRKRSVTGGYRGRSALGGSGVTVPGSGARGGCPSALRGFGVARSSTGFVRMTRRRICT